MTEHCLEIQKVDWDQSLVSHQTRELEENLDHYDESIEFCIALKLRDIRLQRDITENLQAMFRDGAQTPKRAILDLLTRQYFEKYVSNQPRSLGEFFDIFFLGVESTTHKFLELETELPFPPIVDSYLYSDKERDSIQRFIQGARQSRYFDNENAWNYYFEAFVERVKEFSHEEVRKGFEYFLNVQIPMNERFYASGYAQHMTGIDDLEGALQKLCFPKPLQKDRYRSSASVVWSQIRRWAMKVGVFARSDK